MIRNGKYFVAPNDNSDDFKALFRRLMAAGAGRPVDRDGLPPGPWTPDLLADAISRLDANRRGVELRTVQLWFQDNEKGVSPANIQWLARIFGCGDPAATAAWQTELSAAQARLTARRRAARAARRAEPVEIGPRPSRPSELTVPPMSKGSWGLAEWSEHLFAFGGGLNLPASIFAGATALQFIAYFLGIHSITYLRDDGVEKQVGFHWAPNWTFLFMLFLPLFVIFAGHLVGWWRRQGRVELMTTADPSLDWMRKVRRSTATFWSVLIICLGFAGVFQWIGMRLVPLRQGIETGDTDWGSVALERPDVIGVTEAIAFSGFAYLYMSVCFYLMFAGLILLFDLAEDHADAARAALREPDRVGSVEASAATILSGFFRCTVMGLMIAICMNVQNAYLSTDAPHVWAWLFGDAAAGWARPEIGHRWEGYGFAMHYTSLLVALPTCVVMIYGFVRVGLLLGTLGRWWRMAMAVVILVAGYLLVGAFMGFTLLLAIAVLMGLYGLFDPTFGKRAPGTEPGGHHAA